MWREKMKGYIVVEYKWVLMLRVLLAILVAMTAYALVSTVAESRHAVADNAAPVSGRSETVATDRMKPAVVKWMKDNSAMPEQLLSRIYDEAVSKAHPDLILAICLVESNFNPVIKSNKGAVGLMGIVPSVWVDELKSQGIIKEKSDLYLIPNNIDSGLYVLRKYLKRSNDLEQALLDYVGGDLYYVGKVMKALGEIYLVKMLNSSGQGDHKTAATGGCDVM